MSSEHVPADPADLLLADLERVNALECDAQLD